MRVLKFALIFIFLTTFIHGKAHTSFQNHYQKTVAGKQDNDHKFIKTFSDNKSDESPRFKRKFRTKGVEVAIPHISDLSFVQIATYNEFILAPVENTHSSFLHCVERKRGPPSV